MNADPGLRAPPAAGASGNRAVTCDECGDAFTTRKAWARFCTPRHQKSFNNRLARRGARLGGAFMAMRYDRVGARAAGLDWNYICRMAELWHRQDLCAGRASHPPIGEMLARDGAEINARVSRI